MSPGAKDARPQGDIVDRLSKLDDFADFLVAPGRDRVLQTLVGVGEEEPRRGIPALRQIGIGASIERHFGAGTDTGEQGADADLVSAQRTCRLVYELDLA